MEWAKLIEINFKKLFATLIVLLPLYLSNAIAGNEEFSFAGMVDNIGETNIVISDKSFQIASNVAITSAAGLPLALSDINVSDKVGCNFVSDGNQELVITELYKLSDSFNLDEFGLRLSVLVEGAESIEDDGD